MRLFVAAAAHSLIFSLIFSKSPCMHARINYILYYNYNVDQAVVPQDGGAGLSEVECAYLGLVGLGGGVQEGSREFHLLVVEDVHRRRR